MARCDNDPFPIDPKLYLPGSRLKSVISSETPLTLNVGINRQRARLRHQLGDRGDVGFGVVGQCENNSVLIASGPPMLIPMVAPSGAALATASVPVLPLAPGLFSITNGWPSFFSSDPRSGARPRPASSPRRTAPRS